jgi:hypothetical protein
VARQNAAHPGADGRVGGHGGRWGPRSRKEGCRKKRIPPSPGGRTFSTFDPVRAVRARGSARATSVPRTSPAR